MSERLDFVKEHFNLNLAQAKAYMRDPSGQDARFLVHVVC